MHGTHALKVVAMALLCALMVLLAPGAPAQTIRNTAYAHWTSHGQSSVTTSSLASNVVAFDVVQRPVTIDTFVVSSKLDTALSFTASQCGGKMLTVPGLAGSTAVASVAQATKLHIGDVFYFRVVLASANIDAGAIDSITTRLVTTSGDAETIQVFEPHPIAACSSVRFPPPPSRRSRSPTIAASASRPAIPSPSRA